MEAAKIPVATLLLLTHCFCFHMHCMDKKILRIGSFLRQQSESTYFIYCFSELHRFSKLKHTETKSMLH